MNSSDWSIGNESEINLKTKLGRNTKILKDWNVNINFGIKTGFNLAFIIDSKTKDQLIAKNEISKEIIKPILRGRDISKYYFDFKELFVLFTRHGINIDNYPVVKEYLNNYYTRLKPRNNSENVGRKPGPYKWYELQDNIAYYKEFEKPKIIWGEISDKPKFAYDENGYYAEATTFIMTGENLKYILSILNSKLGEWYFNQISTTTGMGTNRWKKYKIELLPLKNINLTEQKPFIELVDKIIEAKKQNKVQDTLSIENKIDELVYKLYDLTPEEIQIVEESFKSN